MEILVYVGKVENREFESSLDKACAILTQEARTNGFHGAEDFEFGVRRVLGDLLKPWGLEVRPKVNSQIFPDISVGDYGVEVKFTVADTWRSIANSVFEGSRDSKALHIYLVFGKMGGVAEVRWERYGDSIVHVRTSHVPRFEVQVGGERSLFAQMRTTYEEFSRLNDAGKMDLVRAYARTRLREGEKLWWVEADPDSPHSLPPGARLYMSLEQEEKRRLRAEATLLCPEVVKPSRSKHKYDNVALYLLTNHGVLVTQARDLFSAGSVAERNTRTGGRNYVLRAIQDIEPEIREAATRLGDELIKEYWGESCPTEQRIREWLRRADKLAKGWTPSDVLFKT